MRTDGGAELGGRYIFGVPGFSDACLLYKGVEGPQLGWWQLLFPNNGQGGCPELARKS